MTSERESALDAILAVMERHKYIREALSESGYVRRVVRGVVERGIELDAIVGRFSSMKIKRMHPVTRNILRLGAFELYYMDSVPSHSTVNECVKLAKKRGAGRAAGMINAILRKIAAEALSGTDPKKEMPPAMRYSMPQWIYEGFVLRFGKERADAICESYLRESPLVVRVNRTLISSDDFCHRLFEAGVKVCRIERLPMALRIENAGSIEKLPGYAKGAFYVQDVGSMQVVIEADIQPGERILDVCAAPGGKAAFAAELCGEDGFVEARDKTEAKCGLIRENMERLGLSRVEVKPHDAEVFDESCREAFDVVLADVPCSGLGVLGRKPEIKYRLKKEDIEQLCKLQKDILDCVCFYVKTGGRLVYATCTMTGEENEAQIAAFLKRHADFEKVRERQIFPDEIAPGNDGFYVCVLRRGAG